MQQEHESQSLGFAGLNFKTCTQQVEPRHQHQQPAAASPSGSQTGEVGHEESTALEHRQINRQFHLPMRLLTKNQGSRKACSQGDKKSASPPRPGSQRTR